MERVKSSDVLDPTHMARRSFRGEVLGHFRRMGPNAWDDYQFVRTAVPQSAETFSADKAGNLPDVPQSLEILPQVPLQLESRGAAVRVRSFGRVVRVRWLADPKDEEILGNDAQAREIRRYFVESCLVPLASESVLGATAVMVKKLGDP